MVIGGQQNLEEYLKALDRHFDDLRREAGLLSEYLQNIHDHADGLSLDNSSTLVLFTGKTGIEPRSPEVNSYQYASWVTTSKELRKVADTPLAQEVNRTLYGAGAPFGEAAKREVDSCMSREACKRAHGNVIVLLPRTVDKDSVFAKVELPSVLANPDVLSINGIKREQLRACWEADRSPDKHIAKDMICQTLRERGPTIEISDRALEQRLAQHRRQAIQKNLDRHAPKPPPPPPPPAPHQSHGY